MGRRHLDRHRVPRGRPGPRGAACLRSAADVPARAGRRRRHRRADDHRAGLQRRRHPAAPAGRGGRPRPHLVHALRAQRSRSHLRDAGDRRVVRVPRLGRPPHARGGGRRPHGAGLPAEPDGGRARARAGAHVPAVPDERVRPRRGQQPARVHLGERAAAVRLQPVRRVRHPAAVRARQRGGPALPGRARRGAAVTGGVGHRRRARRRQVLRDPRPDVRHAPGGSRPRPRSHSGAARRRRSAVRHRVHPLALHRRPGDRRRGRAEPGARRGAHRLGARLPPRDRHLPHDRAAAA